MSPQEAIQLYIHALEELNVDPRKYQFKVENGRIAIGHVFGREVDDVQWGMSWHTPEEFAKMAKLRRLDLDNGDPRRG